MSESRDLGHRDRRAERGRVLALMVLLFVTAVLEITVGRRFESEEVRAVQVTEAEWAHAQFNAPPGRLAAPAKVPGRRRVLFVSNSHAATGGRVPRHLQLLLDEVQPGAWEVLDLSSPGIFAPDMLQRVLEGMSWEPDLLLLSVSYISFADRMGIALQAHSARSFFRPEIFRRLPLGFWWRNLDLGLMTETLVSSRLRLYRYRNRTRDLWEQPLVRALGSDGGKPILFLDVDENQRWRFPDGYDNNLVQPRLYTAGRSGHLGDLRDLVRGCDRAELPIIACNLPMDWRKTLAEPDDEDFRLYRRQVAEILEPTVDYVDLQECFPTGFSTYDSVHPMWHGARLHALDLALRMHDHGFLDVPAPRILEQFDAVEDDISPTYEELVGGTRGEAPLGALRFDLFDPDPAADLLDKLAATEIGGTEEMQLLYGLSRRIVFWRQDLHDEAGCSNGFAPGWNLTLGHEMTRARARIHFFTEILRDLQNRRLADFPIPAIDPTSSSAQTGVVVIEGIPFSLLEHELDGGRSAIFVATREGRLVAVQVMEAGKKTGYRRVDLLGDGSFILAQSTDRGFMPPVWLLDRDDLLKWGW